MTPDDPNTSAASTCRTHNKVFNVCLLPVSGETLGTASREASLRRLQGRIVFSSPRTSSIGIRRASFSPL
jgi:hypothetical protein